MVNKKYVMRWKDGTYFVRQLKGFDITTKRVEEASVYNHEIPIGFMDNSSCLEKGWTAVEVVVSLKNPK